jgi:hypothetical protein
MTHHLSRYIMKYTGSNSNNRIVANGDSGGYIHVRSNPDTASHGYGSVRGLEMRIFIVMARSAKKAFLRDDCMLADLDRRDGIEPDILADPRVIANSYPPGKMYPGPGMHEDILADRTPESFEQPPAEPIAGKRRKAEQDILAQEPQDDENLWATIIEPGMVPLIKTEERHVSLTVSR